MVSYLQQKKLIVHIQCLLRVDGSILAGVFLTSFFCVVPESPTQQVAAYWYSGIRTALVQVASETDGCSAP